MLFCVETNSILLVLWGLAQLTCLRESPPFCRSYQICLCDFLCVDFTLLQPPCPSLLSNCRPVLYIWPTLSNITTTIAMTLPTSPPFFISSSPPWVLFRISSNFTAHYFFMSSEEAHSWLSFILLIQSITEANLQGTRQRLFVKLLFISFIKSSSSPIKEPRTVALDSHITLVSFGEMIYCLI